MNAVTYLDMAMRARPTSDAPEQVVAKISELAGHPVPASGENAEVARAGPIPLSPASATGVGIGAAAGLLRPILGRVPFLFSARMLGARRRWRDPMSPR